MLLSNALTMLHNNNSRTQDTPPTVPVPGPGPRPRPDSDPGLSSGFGFCLLFLKNPWDGVFTIHHPAGVVSLQSISTLIFLIYTYIFIYFLRYRESFLVRLLFVKASEICLWDSVFHLTFQSWPSIQWMQMLSLR